METVAWMFKQLKILGVEEEFVVLAFVGIGVIYMLWLHYRTMKKNFAFFKENTITLQAILATLTKKMKNVDEYHSNCSARNMDELIKVWSQRNTLETKVDNVEDQLKEIKKQMLFKQ